MDRTAHEIAESFVNQLVLADSIELFEAGSDYGRLVVIFGSCEITHLDMSHTLNTFSD